MHVSIMLLMFAGNVQRNMSKYVQVKQIWGLLYLLQT